MFTLIIATALVAVTSVYLCLSTKESLLAVIEARSQELHTKAEGIHSDLAAVQKSQSEWNNQIEAKLRGLETRVQTIEAAEAFPAKRAASQAIKAIGREFK